MCKRNDDQTETFFKRIGFEWIRSFIVNLYIYIYTYFLTYFYTLSIFDKNYNETNLYIYIYVRNMYFCFQSNFSINSDRLSFAKFFHSAWNQ